MEELGMVAVGSTELYIQGSSVTWPPVDAVRWAVDSSTTSDLYMLSALPHNIEASG